MANDNPPKIFGVKFSNCRMNEALEELNALVQKRKQFAAYINAHCMNLAFHDSEYADILNNASVVWPDGIGIKIAGKLLHFPVPENLNGTDMFPLICQQNYSIYMLGAAPGVAQKAMENAQRLYPNAKYVGCRDGFFKTEEEILDAIRKINEVKPDILFVAMGVPKQEKWIHKYLDKIDCGTAIAVGGLLDFVSGRIPRAPMWMRKSGLEWVYRLYQEPIRLFKRYIIGNPLFIMRVLFFNKTK